MERIKERGKIYALHKASDKLNDYYGSAMLNVVQFDGHDIQCAYVDGYLQTKQELEVKEVDLDVEVALWANAIPEMRLDDVERLAKYFYELGLKVR